jgi:hypothetical protein
MFIFKPLSKILFLSFCFSLLVSAPVTADTSFSGWLNSTLTKAHKTSRKVGKSINDAVPEDVKAGARKTGEGIADTGQAIGRAAEPVLRDAVEGTVKIIEKLHW